MLKREGKRTLQKVKILVLVFKNDLSVDFQLTQPSSVRKYFRGNSKNLDISPNKIFGKKKDPKIGNFHFYSGQTKEDLSKIHVLCIFGEFFAQSNILSLFRLKLTWLTIYL